MTVRRYNEAEVAAMFKWAAEAQQTSQPQLPAGQGMTLQQIQEIGREVGISPEQLTAASKAIALSWRPSSRQFLGLPVGVGLVVDMNRKLSDADWEQFVVDLRETFEARGKQKQEGSFRQWTNGNLQVLIEPTAGGDRIRFRTVKGDAQTMMVGGMVMLGAGALVAMNAVASGHVIDFGLFTGTGMLAAMGLGMFAYGGLRLPSWARTRVAQMEKVATRLALGPVQDRPVDPPA